MPLQRQYTGPGRNPDPEYVKDPYVPEGKSPTHMFGSPRRRPHHSMLYPSLVRDEANPERNDPKAQPFYSNLDRVLSKRTAPKMPLRQVLGLLKASGVSNEELLMHPIGRALLSPDTDLSAPLSSLPPGKLDRVWADASMKYGDYRTNTRPLAGDDEAPEPYYAAHLIRTGDPSQVRRVDTEHFHENGDNIAAHVRMQDIHHPGYGRLLEIGEVQSDWTKAYRNHQKYLAAEAAGESPNPYAAHSRPVNPPPLGKHWLGTALKYALHHAAANNYNGVLWTTGEHQVARYGINNLIDGNESILHIGPDGRARQQKFDHINGFDKHTARALTLRTDIPDLVGRIRAGEGQDNDGWTTVPYDTVVRKYLDKNHGITSIAMRDGMRKHYGVINPLTLGVESPGDQYKEAERLVKPYGLPIHTTYVPHNEVFHATGSDGRTYQSWPNRFGEAILPNAQPDGTGPRLRYHSLSNPSDNVYPMPGFVIPMDKGANREIVQNGFPVIGYGDASTKSLLALAYDPRYVTKSYRHAARR